MGRIISFLFVSTIIVLSRIFYRCQTDYLNCTPEEVWEHNTRLFVFLNHTSLFEPLLFAPIPFHFVWWSSKNVVIPGADITLNRPLVGLIFKTIFPQIISITRKRDDSWKEFMEAIKPESMIVIAPEGRMKRADGLDKNGNPMSIKSGVADILENLDSGKMIIAYSGGLHHVQVPGDWKVGLFKTIKINFEMISIDHYKNNLPEGESFHRAVVDDLTERMKHNCPT